jgi:hypothetical protein
MSIGKSQKVGENFMFFAVFSVKATQSTQKPRSNANSEGFGILALAVSSLI